MPKKRRTRKQAKPSESDNDLQEEILQELILIRRLVILQLLGLGINGRALAKWLETDQGNFSREYPVKKLYKKSNDQ